MLGSKPVPGFGRLKVYVRCTLDGGVQAVTVAERENGGGIRGRWESVGVRSLPGIC